MVTHTIRKILTRDFILCFAAQFIFTSAAFSLLPTLPIYLSRLGQTETEIGLLIGSFFISSLILRPFVGRALLNIPEKYFMIVGSLFFAFGSIAYLFAPPFWPFLMVRVFQGIGFAFFTTASFTLVANISPEAHRGQSFSYFIVAVTISSALAPPLGMFIINQFSFPLLFWFCLGLSLCSIVITHKLGKGKVVPLQDASTKDGLFFSRKALQPSIFSFFPFFFWGAISTFFPIYAINHGMTNPGFFFTTIGMMLILARVFGGRILDLYSRERIIMHSFTPYVVSMVLLSFSKTVPMFILVAVILSIGPAFLIPALMTYAIDRGGSPGPAMGTFNAIADLGICLGPVIMGIVIHLTSYPTMFLCIALAAIINLVCFYSSVRRKKPGQDQIFKIQ
jgi:predicted MFS family arabinose efflux permease